MEHPSHPVESHWRTSLRNRIIQASSLLEVLLSGLVLIGLITNMLPFAVLPLYSTIEKLDKSLIEASADLGASAATTFMRVTLPITFPGIFSAIILVFIPSLGIYTVTDMLGGGKISKSKANTTVNVIDPIILAERYGVDALRYYLLREFPFGSDGNFSNESLIKRINIDLANDLGNLVSRTTGMAEKYFGGKLPVQREDTPEDCELKKMACALRDRYQAEMDKLQLQNGLDEVFKVIDRANKYIDETAPWTLGKDESKRVRLATVLYNLLETIRVCTMLLMPVMPDTCEKIFAKIGAGAAARTWDNANVWGVLPTEAQVSKGENLFPRVDAEATLEKLNAMQEAQKKAALPAVEVEPFVQEEVDFDTFLKSDFRAVKIKNCEAVKKSDKLLKFTLDDGSGTDRIILSGIHQYYEPEQLIGKTAIAILNLPPRKMMGIPSCGMLISAVHKEKGEEKLHLMLIDDSVPAGAKLY